MKIILLIFIVGSLNAQICETGLLTEIATEENISDNNFFDFSGKSTVPLSDNRFLVAYSSRASNDETPRGEFKVFNQFGDVTRGVFVLIYSHSPQSI